MKICKALEYLNSLLLTQSVEFPDALFAVREEFDLSLKELEDLKVAYDGQN